MKILMSTETTVFFELLPNGLNPIACHAYPHLPNSKYAIDKRFWFEQHLNGKRLEDILQFVDGVLTQRAG
jgi:hypothetical protein